MVDEKPTEEVKETEPKRERVRPHPPVKPELVMDPMGPTPED